MRRLFLTVSLALMISGVYWMYDAKRDNEQVKERVQHLKAEIKQQKRAILTLKADLSVLTQPARIQQLVEQYQEQLELAPISKDQIASVYDLIRTYQEAPSSLSPGLNDPVNSLSDNSSSPTKD